MVVRIALSKIYKTFGKEGLTKVLHNKYQIKSTSSVIRRMKNRKLIETDQSISETD